jgi:DNA polymerase-3 subunit beta
MKVTFDRMSFLEAFSLVASVTPTRTTKDILRNVLLSVKDETATLLGTDGEVEILVTLKDGVTSDQAGSVVIPVTRGLSILRESSGDTVELELENGDSVNALRLKSNRSKFRLPTADPALFPAFQSLKNTCDPDAMIQMKREDLVDGIGKTSFAVDTAQRSGRFSTGGLLVQSEGERLAFVATCGRRIVSNVIDVTSGPKITNNTTIVPLKAAKAILVAAKSSSDSVASIHAGSSRFSAAFGDVVIHARLIEGRFPDWRRMVPEKVSDNSAVVQASEADRSIRQASICTDKESSGIRFTFGSNLLVLEASAAETGDSRVECIAGYAGKESSVILNGKLVADFCRILDSEDDIFVSMDGLRSSNGAPMVHLASGDLSMCIAPMTAG